jgi:hypothetical protein
MGDLWKETAAMSKSIFVPFLYRRSGIVAFSAFLAERRINSLLVFNTPRRRFRPWPPSKLLKNHRIAGLDFELYRFCPAAPAQLYKEQSSAYAH